MEPVDLHVGENFLHLIITNKTPSRPQLTDRGVFDQDREGPAKVSVSRGVIPAEDKRCASKHLPKTTYEHEKELTGCQP
ncbi:hypothetical protein F2Q69_00047969 [Brassica cretica]|uniref:Uncharacterized protein n=1 Tax=Brassica cretica TaxID=69181 RepID=A0A8S9Q4N2_BRACR|nr:hypothetical protein F2Q69_00047969 [Brassica cretica]